MSEFRLTVAASDKTAEITVLDSRQNLVLTGLGQVSSALPAGLYELRTRLGPATQEQLISLARDQTLTISTDDFQFRTPVPLANTAQTRPYHQQAAAEASRMRPVALGSGATLLVFARDWSPKEDTTGNPLLGLTLHDAMGTELRDLTVGADFRQSGDVSAGILVSVNPGAYLIRLKLANGTAYERVIVAVAGWQTQIFMFRQDYDDDRRADLSGGAIVMAGGPNNPGPVFDPAGKGERVAVLARYALIQRRPVADAVYQELFDLKVDDPILGLLAAHLLLRDEPDQRSSLDNVMGNLRRMLGTDHPDVRALDLRAGASPPTNLVLGTPPMLRASWDIVTAASVARPEIIPDDKLFDSVQGAVLPSLPWLIWQVSGGEAQGDSLPFAFGMPGHRMEALKAFLVGQGSALASRARAGAEIGGGIATRIGGGIAGAPDAETQEGVAMRNLQAFVAPSGKLTPINLADNVKVELTRSLGVSGARLDAMLSSVWDDTTKIA